MSTVKFVAQSVLDAELNAIKNNCTKVSVLSTYTSGDSSSTITANTLATSGTITAGSMFGSITGTTDRAITLNSSFTYNASASGTATQLAFLDASGNPLWVTTVTSQAITSGNPVTFPTVSYTASATLS